MKIGLLASKAIIVLSHAVPMLCPLLYVIFGFPSPSFWYTPLGIHDRWDDMVKCVSFSESLTYACAHFTAIGENLCKFQLTIQHNNSSRVCHCCFDWYVLLGRIYTGWCSIYNDLFGYLYQYWNLRRRYFADCGSPEWQYQSQHFYKKTIEATYHVAFGLLQVSERLLVPLILRIKLSHTARKCG